MVKYYAIRDEAAATEYKEKVVERLGNFLRTSGYDSYAIGMTHAGYSAGTAVAIVYAIFEGKFATEDAVTLVNELFPSLGCVYISRIVCFRGSVLESAGEYGLKEYMNPVGMRASISVKGGNNSFASAPRTSEKRFESIHHHGSPQRKR